MSRASTTITCSTVKSVGACRKTSNGPRSLRSISRGALNDFAVRTSGNLPVYTCCVNWKAPFQMVVGIWTRWIMKGPSVVLSEWHVWASFYGGDHVCRAVGMEGDLVNLHASMKTPWPRRGRTIPGSVANGLIHRLYVAKGTFG